MSYSLSFKASVPLSATTPTTARLKWNCSHWNWQLQSNLKAIWLGLRFWSLLTITLLLIFSLLNWAQSNSTVAQFSSFHFEVKYRAGKESTIADHPRGEWRITPQQTSPQRKWNEMPPWDRITTGRLSNRLMQIYSSSGCWAPNSTILLSYVAHGALSWC